MSARRTYERGAPKAPAQPGEPDQGAARGAGGGNGGDAGVGAGRVPVEQRLLRRGALRPGDGRRRAAGGQGRATGLWSFAEPGGAAALAAGLLGGGRGSKKEQQGQLIKRLR